MFRRKQDDDPFAALNEANERGTTTITSGTAAPPRAAASAGGSGDDGSAAFGSSAPAPRAPKRRRNAPLVLLTIVASLGGAGALLHFSDSPADEAGEGAYFTGPQRDRDSGPGRTTASEPERERPPAEPRRVDLVQPAGFGEALARIQQRLRGGERVWLLRVARDRVNALTRLRDGDQRSIDVDADLSTRATDSGSAGSHRGIPLSRISALAPATATRNAARRAHVSPRKLDYLVMTTPIIPGDRPDWQLFFRDVPAPDSHFAASLDGRTVKRPGEQSTTTSTLTITTNGRTRTITGAQAQRIGDCIRRAGSDGARIRRCLP